MESINLICNRYPNIKSKMENPDNPNILLTTGEAVFYQMCLFFENPKLHQVSLNTLYDHLKDNDLLFALEMIIYFFKKDTDRVINVDQTFYDNNILSEPLAGQSKFSEMVEAAIPDMKFKASMINVYWRRGTRIPNADLIIGGTPYWKESTINEFIEKEIKKRK